MDFTSIEEIEQICFSTFLKERDRTHLFCLHPVHCPKVSEKHDCVANDKAKYHHSYEKSRKSGEEPDNHDSRLKKSEERLSPL